MENRSETADRISLASATISEALAPPRFTRARVCFDESPALPSRKPREYPAFSIYHAAEILACSVEPSPTGKHGGSAPATWAMASAASLVMIGFLKKLPALLQSGSPSTSSIPL